MLIEDFPHKFAKATPVFIKVSHVCRERIVPIFILCGNFQIQINQQREKKSKQHAILLSIVKASSSWSSEVKGNVMDT